MEQYSEKEILIRKRNIFLERIKKEKNEQEQSERRFKKCIRKMVCSFLLIFICYGIFYITDSENFLAYLMFTTVRMVAAMLMFVMIGRFFLNLFIFLGECGMPTFAKLFCGGREGTYAEVKERTSENIVQLYMKIYLIEEEIETHFYVDVRDGCVRDKSV